VLPVDHVGGRVTNCDTAGESKIASRKRLHTGYGNYYIAINDSLGRDRVGWRVPAFKLCGALCTA